MSGGSILAGALIKRRDFIKAAAKSTASLAGLGLYSLSSRASVGNNEYEFIIVGAGAGGGPLAVNLARAGFSVLLLEAGGDKLPLSSQIPAYHGLASEDPQIAWDFMVKHYDQPHNHGKWSEKEHRRGVLYPRSSVVGGCTTSNAMICLYPEHDDWDRIFRLTGSKDESWQSSKMRKIFTDRIENAHYFRDRAKGWHNLEMAPFSLLKRDSLLKKIVLGAAKDRAWYFDELKRFSENLAKNIFQANSYLDANNSKHLNDEGLLRIPKSTYLGKRYGVYEYVMEASRRYSNLTVIPHTLVKKVVFQQSKDGLKAIGVEALRGRNLYSAHKLSSRSLIREEVFFKAQKEVILCGGAFNSPQTLLLSGIGPADQFDSLKAGAPLKQKPKIILEGVGRNLQDRYEVSVVTKMDKEIELLKNCEFDNDFTSATSDKCLLEWMNEATRKQSVYSTNGVLAAIKMKSSVSQAKKTDLLLFGVPGDFRGYYPGYSKALTAHKDRFTWVILKGHSRNRTGRVKLKNDNCLETPDIHFHYFEGSGAKEDMQAVLEGVKKVRGINRRTFKESSISSKASESRPGKGEIYPGEELQTNSELESWIQKEAWGHHASCTNKMGLHPKDGSVVNSDFLVHGTKNLRVVDASIFPEIPGLFIVTPIYMISEKASDVIIRKYS